MKIACVLITHLPVKAELRRNGAIRHKPVLIVTQSSRGAEVLDFSSQVKDVTQGMPLQEALSRCKDAVLIEADETYYHRMFDQIVEALLPKEPCCREGRPRTRLRGHAWDRSDLWGRQGHDGCSAGSRSSWLRSACRAGGVQVPSIRCGGREQSRWSDQDLRKT